MFELVVEKTIACAHFLRNYSGACERLHGHNYTIRVYVRGTRLDDAGMVADFGEIKAALKPILERLDHYNLNDLSEFETVSPSAENIAKLIADHVAKYPFGNARLHRVEVWETPTQAATYFVDAD